MWNFDAENRLKGEGSWQNYVSMREDVVWPMPNLVLDEVATQFAVNLWMLHEMSNLQIPKGEYVLETIAGSILGRQLIYFARHWGIKTINLVRCSEQKGGIEGLGCR